MGETFPRGLKAMPRIATPPRFPSAAQAWGQSGKGQVRSVQNMGRTWTEIYPVLDADLATVRALLAAINRGQRDGVLWDVQHPYWHDNKGALGGTPVVSGGGQTGNTLNISGGPSSQSGWLLAGDMIKVVGAAVVFDVTGTVNTDGGGAATIPINPPIFVGGSPSGGAAVEEDATNIFFEAYIGDVRFPDQDVTKYLAPGLQVEFREQPV